jgi:hypothetical protein
MSMSGSIPVSMISIMAVPPVFCHQSIEEAVVGKSLQRVILILKRETGSFQLGADFV